MGVGMPNMTRRSAVAVGLAGGFCIRKARAAGISLKLGNSLPADYPLNVRLNEAASRIKAATSGRVEIQVFPNSQLGGDTDMLSQARSGALELFVTAGLILSSLAPAAAITGLGFIFKDYQQIWPALDGALGERLRTAFTRSGLQPIAPVFDLGFREVTSSRGPIQNPGDFAGFKVRVPPSPIYVSLFKALGAAPVAINFSELYSALQTGIVTGQENPLSLIESGKLFEVQKFCSLTNHVWDGLWLVSSPAAWERIPAALRGTIQEHLHAAVMAQRTDMVALNEAVRNRLTQKGMTFNTVDPEPFRKVLREAGFYSSAKARFDASDWTVLEQAVGGLG
jgi:tripartite ATP-independent transporter DctP family solute receptor